MDINLLCSNCFKNFGLRTLAEDLAKDSKFIECENCGSTGLKIEKSTANNLMSLFFVSGSVPPGIGGSAPIYQYNEVQYPGKIDFATELDSDLQLLSEYLKIGLFHYGPPLWMIGATEHYNILTIDNVKGNLRKNIWKDILDRCETKIFSKDTQIYRIRTGEKMPPALPEHFDSPPAKFMQEGRFHTKDFPLFYGALDVETCLHETRITLQDYSMLAVFQPCNELKILNISENIDDSKATTPFERVDIFMKKLAYSGKNHYPLCQELAKEVKLAGYDGFISTSYFGQAHKEKLYNINLFGYPVKEGKIKLISTNRIFLKSLSYEYQYGPTNDTHVPLDLDEMKKVMDEMIDLFEKSDDLDHKKLTDLQNQFNAILEKKSDSPI